MEQNLKSGIDSLSRDRISELPETLRLHILSFLPTEDCIRTSLIAKGWRYLWKFVSSLNFNYSDDHTSTALVREREKFLNFVDQVFMLRDSSDLYEFCLYYRSLRKSLSKSTVRSFNLWVAVALKLRAKKLCLHLYPESSVLELPSSRTLEVLSLTWGTINLQNLSQLCELRTLELVAVGAPSESFSNDLFSYCPALETLRFLGCDFSEWSLMCISAPSLKNIFLDECEWDDCVIKVSAPSLQRLHVNDCVWDNDCTIEVSAQRLNSFKYGFRSLPKSFVFQGLVSVDSAVISSLGACFDYDDIEASKVRFMLGGLLNIRKLNLDIDSDVVFERLPPFDCMEELTVPLYHCICDDYVNSVIKFLNSNCKMQTLNISEFVDRSDFHYDGDEHCCSQVNGRQKFTLHLLKKLVVKFWKRDDKEIEWVELLKSNSPHLNEVIRINSFGQEDEEEGMEDEEEEEDMEDEGGQWPG
ncbi:hypothetical protein H6P81_017401 [Aristolochia fimbriata]|uniref:F-box domain-containing protein n=1 Tax=Aristolochia fimbriata TaxID=158543 RepID=A0AAV7DY85_ARIFI|nr:hypothetical protein H6P81_017401 [Aristolochia fimbriata]